MIAAGRSPTDACTTPVGVSSWGDRSGTSARGFGGPGCRGPRDQRVRACAAGSARTPSTPAARKGSRATSVRRWSGCVGRIVVSRWRSRSQEGKCLLHAGERAPKIGFRLVHELAANGYPVAGTCWVLKVSRSGYYEWRDRPPSKQDLDDVYLANAIVDIHAMSRASTAPTAPRRTTTGPWCQVRRKQGRPVASGDRSAPDQPPTQASSQAR